MILVANGSRFIQIDIMSESQLKLRYLLDQLTNNQITRAEFDELFALVNRGEYEEDIKALLLDGLGNDPLPEVMERERLNTVLKSIMMVQPPEQDRTEARVRQMIVWKRLAAAAAIVLLIGSGIWFGLMRTPKTGLVTNDKKATLTNTKDIEPGGNKAILTLGDHSTIVLDDAANGQLAKEGSSRVNKTKDGELIYQSAIDNKQLAIVYNTLATPRGGQYQLVLPDGSKVWLNAAASIKFPTAFAGNERRVEITGEVYFEVAPIRLRSGQKMPFKVAIPGGVAVEVLGTHFNINAYDDEPAQKITLIEGRVKVGSGQWAVGSGEKGKGQRAEGREEKAEGKKESVVLQPGEQVSVSHTSQISQPIPVQTEDVLAWKNGLFHFENVDIKTVMRQLSRWYDIEVEYKGAIKTEPLFIELPRKTTLLEVLKVLETTAGLQLRLEGKKVTVL
jgi:transmembrane sensor